MLQQQKILGKKIVLVSDFYLELDFYEMMLKHLGIDNLFDDIFISSMFCKTKRDGGLYKVVQQKYPNKKMVMIGDNKEADYNQSVNNGFNGIWYEKGNKKFKYFIRNIKIDKKCFKEYKRIFNLKTSSKTVSNYAFSLYEFCERLYKKCVKEDIQRLNFLSREGQFLKILFDDYQVDKFKKVETNYLCVSRYSSFLPSLHNMPFNKKTLNNLFKNYNDMTLRDFCKNLQLTDEEINSLQRPDIDEIVHNFSESNLFEELQTDDSFMNMIQKKINKSYDDFVTYFNKVTNNDEKIYLVDVGWKGTMQDNLSQIFKEKEFVGLYLGLDYLNTLDTRNKKQGILWDINRNSYYINHINFEYTLKADHGKVETYENGQPIFKKDGDVEIYNKYVKSIQQDLLYKFRLIKQARNNDLIHRHKNNILMKLHKKMMKANNLSLIKMEYKIWLYHNENFGNIKDLYGTASKVGFLKFYLQKKRCYLINNIKFLELD